MHYVRASAFGRGWSRKRVIINKTSDKLKFIEQASCLCLFNIVLMIISRKVNRTANRFVFRDETSSEQGQLHRL